MTIIYGSWTIKISHKTQKIIKELNGKQPIEMVPTFLGAHEFPDEYRDNREEYDCGLHSCIII